MFIDIAQERVTSRDRTEGERERHVCTHFIQVHTDTDTQTHRHAAHTHARRHMGTALT